MKIKTIALAALALLITACSASAVAPPNTPTPEASTAPSAIGGADLRYQQNSKESTNGRH